MLDPSFHGISIIYMDMADDRVLFFINLDNPLEQFLDSKTTLADCRDNGCSDHLGQ